LFSFWLAELDVEGELGWLRGMPVRGGLSLAHNDHSTRHASFQPMSGAVA